MKTPVEIRTEITKKIVDAISKGNFFWRRPWDCGGCLPKNFVSKRAYQGVNPLILMWSASVNDFSSSYWGTEKQWNKIGGKVKEPKTPLLPGEMRGTEIIYYSMVSTATLKKKPKGNAKFIPIMRMFEVFNADQIEGTEKITKYLYHEKDVTGVDFAKADKLIKSSKAVIRHTGQQAFYVPPRLAKDGNQIGGDYIQMPRPGYFDGVAEYYETLFHEMVHWTEHPKRCNWIRKDKNDYAPGELIAELGACFLCAELGIPTSENLLERSQGYLQHWLQNMNENPHYLFQSAKQASKAVDFLLAFVKKPKKKKKVVAS